MHVVYALLIEADHRSSRALVRHETLGRH